jgi:predicted anti-sigma-YlaC factor YlaD
MNASVTCLDVRRILGAEPQRRDAGIAEHLKDCAACANFSRDMLALDARLQAAFKVPVPEGLEARIVLDGSLKNHRRAWRPWLAAAASVTLVTMLGTFAWRHDHPAEAELAAAVVNHIENPEEASAMAPDRALLHDAAYVEDVMQKAGAGMQGGMQDVAYAQVCLFRGERVAHLVVEGPNGPVTVMLLRHTHVDRQMPVDEDGFHGVIVPAGKGSIAIVTRSSASLQPMAQELSSKVEWTL